MNKLTSKALQSLTPKKWRQRLLRRTKTWAVTSVKIGRLEMKRGVTRTEEVVAGAEVKNSTFDTMSGTRASLVTSSSSLNSEMMADCATATILSIRLKTWSGKKFTWTKSFSKNSNVWSTSLRSSSKYTNHAIKKLTCNFNFVVGRRTRTGQRAIKLADRS